MRQKKLKLSGKYIYFGKVTTINYSKNNREKKCINDYLLEEYFV